MSNNDVRLPKLVLPKFSGDILEFETFWDQFQANIDDSYLPDISKFSYLRNLLEGDATQTIQGLTLTAQNYKAACKILKDRFGRKERIIFTHIQKLLNLSVPNKCTVSALWKLNDCLQAHIRSLESFCITGEQYGAILTPMILSRLPQDIRLEWSRDGEGHESDLEFLLKFLSKEIQWRERSHVFKDSQNPSHTLQEEKHIKNHRISTASALQSTSSSKPLCGVCRKTHPTNRCFRLLQASFEERRNKLSAAGFCFRCLRSGHIARGCSASCSNCRGCHHVILCNPQVPDKIETVPKSVTPSVHSNEDANVHVANNNTVLHNNVSTEVTVTLPGSGLTSRSRKSRIV